MANLTDLQNRLQTIAEAEKNGGILDIPTEAIHILAMCNSIRIEMINEMCEGIDPEQCDEQLFIQLVSKAKRTVCDMPQVSKCVARKEIAECTLKYKCPFKQTDC